MGNCWSVKKSKRHAVYECEDSGCYRSFEMVDLTIEKCILQKKISKDSDLRHSKTRPAIIARRTKSCIPVFSDRRSSKKLKNQVNENIDSNPLAR